MGVRLSARMAVLLGFAPLSLVSGCSLGGSSEAPSVDVATSTVIDIEPIQDAYAAAPVDLQRVVGRFLRAVCAYNSRHQHPLDFLDRSAGLTTSAAQDRLAASPRAHLDWPALRAREERSRVRVDGVSLVAGSRTDQAVVFATLSLTTITSFATVRAFETATVRLARIDGAWLVEDMTGACS